MLGQMNAVARQLALQGLRARHSEATEAQLQRYLADLLLGPELAARADFQRQTGHLAVLQSKVSDLASNLVR